MNNALVAHATTRGNLLFIKLLWEVKYLVLQEKSEEFFSCPTLFLNNALRRQKSLSRNSVVSLYMGSSCPQTCNKNQREREREHLLNLKEPRAPPEITGTRVSRMGPSRLRT